MRLIITEEPILPSNGASMHDAARTREDEPADICDTCNFGDVCSHDAQAACVRALEEQDPDEQYERRRDER